MPSPCTWRHNFYFFGKIQAMCYACILRTLSKVLSITYAQYNYIGQRKSIEDVSSMSIIFKGSPLLLLWNPWFWLIFVWVLIGWLKEHFLKSIMQDKRFISFFLQFTVLAFLGLLNVLKCIRFQKFRIFRNSIYVNTFQTNLTTRPFWKMLIDFSIPQKKGIR